ncbi:hypothetical protein pneo_cds_373 [Pandoravirus neocaledonia]|uniref:Uncharacterized protein n=1 Tax=Pandoravirus neocaledonia TaxID=2107708 RepID=A0A2U7UCC8_9VIRU|nr:hypothetical protein pneo_cds_373 [Pandoravirus neocaledonia]AVK75980.1 hypothetical protein pneo_cds_373 [Pandoravirus neocaledonia]
MSSSYQCIASGACAYDKANDVKGTAVALSNRNKSSMPMNTVPRPAAAGSVSRPKAATPTRHGPTSKADPTGRSLATSRSRRQLATLRAAKPTL